MCSSAIAVPEKTTEDTKPAAEKFYLPDGTEIKFENNKAYYYCHGKFLLLPDGAYMLADGSLFTMTRGRLTELIFVKRLKKGNEDN